MTYSHNSSNKMASPSVACSDSAAKLKSSSAVVAAVRHHSSSIAIGTILSTSPTGSMSSGSSISSSLSSSSSNSCVTSASSFGSNCSGGGGMDSGSCNDSGFFANRKNQNRANGGGWQRQPSGKLNRCASGNKILTSQQRISSNYLKNQNFNQVQNNPEFYQKHQQGNGLNRGGSSECHTTNSPNPFGSNLACGESARKSIRNAKVNKGSTRNVNNGGEIGGLAVGYFSNSNQLQQQLQQRVSPTALKPMNLTHFAGSKCFDAPAPTALPKPPQHWTMSGNNSTGAISGAKLKEAAAAGHGLLAVPYGGCGAHNAAATNMHPWKFNLLDDFDTHNLKLLLNVQS